MDAIGLDGLRTEILSLVKEAGDFFNVLPGLNLHRKESRTPCELVCFQPRIVLIVQGTKTAKIGCMKEKLFQSGDCIAAGFELPDGTHYLEGSPEKPYLCISYFLKEELVQELLLKINNNEMTSDVAPVMTTKANERIIQSFCSLLKTIHDPIEQRVLAPIIERELAFHILMSPLGAFYKQVFTPKEPYARIMKSIDFIHKNFRKATDIETLSALACMAPTTFHRHFKAFTQLSPKQFQKMLRLKEACQLIGEDHYSCRKAAEEVGYDNQSQFNREFKAQYGFTPQKLLSSRNLKEVNRNPAGTTFQIL